MRLLGIVASQKDASRDSSYLYSSHVCRLDAVFQLWHLNDASLRYRSVVVGSRMSA